MSETAQVIEEQPQGRSWKKMIFQAILFQVILRFISPKTSQRTPQDSIVGEPVPPLRNRYSANTTFDVYAYIHSNRSAELKQLRYAETPLWFASSEKYVYNRKAKARQTNEPITYTLSQSLLDSVLTQHRGVNPNDVLDKNASNKTELTFTESTEQLLEKWSGLGKLRRLDALKKDWRSIYLVVFAVPHDVYRKINNCKSIPKDIDEAVKCLQAYENMGSDASEHILRGSIDLIEYTKPLVDDELQSLWFNKDASTEDLLETTKNTTHEGALAPYWKNHIDIRFVVDASLITPHNLGNPHLRKLITLLPEDGLYLPVLQPSDVWLLERNYVQINETTRDNPTYNLTLTLNGLNIFWWSIQSQLSDIWNPSGDGPMTPWLAIQRQSKSETFMLKRVILDTNPYVLIFSALLMILHSIFSFLAIKNDIQFWHHNKSMQGLSMLSLLFNFFCDIIIALYLYDSKEASSIVLFEIGLGLVLSAWKLTKAVNISLKYNSERWLPTIEFHDRQSYEESDTKKYDRIAICFMSKFLLPCVLAYAGYALRYKKFKSWYSFIISTLAGSVYAFGFITMTPQLYINYKLKSVDHLPWRTFTYKALNTFVDDVAAFIIDMPWMHRLACLRDDVIFVCYLYQRWIYSVDKTRTSEWTTEEAVASDTKQQDEKEEDKGEELKKSEDISTLRERKTLPPT